MGYRRQVLVYRAFTWCFSCTMPGTAAAAVGQRSLPRSLRSLRKQMLRRAGDRSWRRTRITSAWPQMVSPVLGSIVVVEVGGFAQYRPTAGPTSAAADCSRHRVRGRASRPSIGWLSRRSGLCRVGSRGVEVGTKMPWLSREDGSGISLTFCGHLAHEGCAAARCLHR